MRSAAGDRYVSNLVGNIWNYALFEFPFVFLNVCRKQRLGPCNWIRIHLKAHQLGERLDSVTRVYHVHRGMLISIGEDRKGRI